MSSTLPCLGGRTLTPYNAEKGFPFSMILLQELNESLDLASTETDRGSRQAEYKRCIHLQLMGLTMSI